MTTQNELDLVTMQQKIDEAIRTGNISESHRLRRLRDRQIGFQVGDWVVDSNDMLVKIIDYDENDIPDMPWCVDNPCDMVDTYYYTKDEPFIHAIIDDFAFDLQNITRKVAVCINKRNEIVVASEDCEHHPENHWDIQAWRELARLNNKPVCPPEVHKGNYRLGGENEQ